MLELLEEQVLQGLLDLGETEEGKETEVLLEETLVLLENQEHQEREGKMGDLDPKETEVLLEETLVLLENQEHQE